MNTQPRVLVIDDSEFILEQIRAALEAAGIGVTTTTQPVGNARHLKSCELVIVDFHMPGIDGSAVARSLRSAMEGSDASCLIYLYSSDVDVAASFARHGFDGSFTHKGDVAALVPQVQAALRVSRLRALARKRAT